MNQATFLSQTLWYFSEASAFTDVLLVCKDGQVAKSHHQKHHHYPYHQSLCTVGLQRRFKRVLLLLLLTLVHGFDPTSNL